MTFKRFDPARHRTRVLMNYEDLLGKAARLAGGKYSSLRERIEAAEQQFVLQYQDAYLHETDPRSKFPRMRSARKGLEQAYTEIPDYLLTAPPSKLADDLESRLLERLPAPPKRDVREESPSLFIQSERTLLTDFAHISRPSDLLSLPGEDSACAAARRAENYFILCMHRLGSSPWSPEWQRQQRNNHRQRLQQAFAPLRESLGYETTQLHLDTFVSNVNSVLLHRPHPQPGGMER